MAEQRKGPRKTSTRGLEPAPVEETIAVLGNKFPFPVCFYPDPRREADLVDGRRALKKPHQCGGVLVIYTGGTIGSGPADSQDPDSPQIVKDWPELVEYIPPICWTGVGAVNFTVDAISFKKALDSANVGPKEWSAIAQIIRKYLDKYEGFVIAHGTDTLVYTASALSFILENLSKPVILTGAQLSAIGAERNDAQQNLVTAILLANPTYSAIPPVPEVCIFFRDKLLRGNRTKKMDAEGYIAFDSPNIPPLGLAGAKIEIDESRIRPYNGLPLQVRDILNTSVIALDVFPGIQGTDLLREICKSVKGLAGIVLRTYGTGNTSTDDFFLKQISEATEQGIVVLNVTQCSRGGVEMGLYETSARLVDCGVCSGQDITAEAALCKMMVLLGERKQREGLTREMIIAEIQKAWTGEQSHSLVISEIPQNGAIEAGTGSRRFRTSTFPGPLDKEQYSKALLRFRGAKVLAPNVDVETRHEGAPLPRVGIKLLIDVLEDEHISSEDDNNARFAGRFSKEHCPDPRTVIFDITRAAKNNLKTSKRSSFTIEVDAPGAAFSWTSVELVLFQRAI